MWRDVALTVAAATTIAACSGEDVADGQVDHVTGFIGLVAAEEPRSALIGRDTLSAGGSAADAAVAIALAQAVTYQGRVGLGGGGVCVVYSAADEKADAIDFRARAARGGEAATGEAVGVPGMVRGLYALQARYGRLRWGGLVAPAEQLARFGNSVSRAFAGDIDAADVSRGDLAELFGGVKEGSRVERLDLAASLAQVRIKGPGAFYSGPLARRYVEGVTAAGGAISLADLRGYQPKWTAVETLSIGNFDAYTADSAAGARTAFALFQRVAESDGGADARVWQASLTPGDDSSARSVGGPAPSSGFVVVDRQGQAVSCALTMNGAFGAGKLAGDTGMLIAKPATPESDAELAPVVVANRYLHKPYLAASAGGDGAAAALTRVLAARYVEDAPLTSALGGDAPGVVAAAECRNGIPSGDLRCSAAVDPRANGLSIP